MTRREAGISRRDFVRYASAGAVSVCLSGCGPLVKHRARLERAAPQAPVLLDGPGFRRLADLVLDVSQADHVLVSLRECADRVVRFSDNRLGKRRAARRQSLVVQVAFGQQTATGYTDDFSETRIKKIVRWTEQLAQEADPDPDYVLPLPPQCYPVLATYRPETAEARLSRCEAVAAELIGLCEAEGLQATGHVGVRGSAAGAAASTELFAFERRTRAEFDLTIGASGGRVRVSNANRSIDDLQAIEHVRIAIGRAKRAATRQRVRAGRQTVILEPPAVAALLRALLDATDARSYHAGTSPLAGQLGQRIIDARLTLRNRPDHPALLGRGFAKTGMPSDARVWIEQGMLNRLHYDRVTAREHDTSPTYAPDACHLSGNEPAAESTADLVRATKHALLVSRLDQVAYADPATLTLGGTTCGGTFLISDGAIVGGAGDLAWRESPLEALNRLAAFTLPGDALVRARVGVTGSAEFEAQKMLVPAMAIEDFHICGES
jgi:predicted Zn-dependent protease